MNKVLEDMLHHCITPKMDNWDDKLPVLEFAVKNYQTVSKTRFYAYYGKLFCVPDDITCEGNPSRNPQT